MRGPIRLVHTAVTIALALAVPGLHVRAQRPAANDRPPKLLVRVAVDQLRADYIDRFGQQWTRGLHRLLAQGAWFRQTLYPYANTVTCAGHSTIGTGTIPSVHGMILNSWWDRASRKEVKC